MLSIIFEISPGRKLPADRSLDEIAEASGLFDAETRGRSHVEIKRTAIDPGEEVSPEPRHDKGNDARQAMKNAVSERTAMMKATFEHSVITARGDVQTLLQSEPATERMDCGWTPNGAPRRVHARSRDTWTSSGPGCAKASRRPTWQIPPLRRAGRTGTAPPR